jgi:hypothetical protein
MSGKRILLYLLAAGLLGLLIYALVPKDSGRGPDDDKEAQGDDDADTPRRSRSHTGGGTARLPRIARRPGQKTTKILGRAIDGDTGKPVAEVDVQLSSSLDSAQATTRTDGRFKLEVVAGGAYAVSLTSSTHVAAGLAPTLQVKEGHDIKGLVLVLHELASVTGRVVDSKLDPVTPASVRVARARGQRRIAETEAAPTDARGRFSIKVPPGEVVLRADSARHGAAHSPPLYVKAGAHLSGVMIRLGGGMGLTGKVVGPGRQRIAAAEVVLRDELGKHKVPCDGDGNFALGGLTAGIKQLQAAAKGFSPSHVTKIRLRAGTNKTIYAVLVLRAAKGIGGQVLDGEGNPVGGVKVVVRPGSPRGRLTHLLPALEQRTNPAGQFMFNNVPPTPLVVTASSGSGKASRAGVPPGTFDVTLRLQRTGGISGEVTDGLSGTAVRDYTVSVTRAEGTGDPLGQLPAIRVVSADGAFDLEGLVPGTYAVTVTGRGYGAEARSKIAVTADHHSRISVVLNAGGSVQGVVVDPRGVGLPGAAVRMDTGWHGSPAVADAQGRFRIDNVARGRRSLSASHPGHDTRILGGVSVFPKQTTDVRVELSLRRGERAGFKLSGIGAVLSDRNGAVTVIKTLPGSPAEAAGLLRGDRVSAVDGKAPSSFAEAIEAIRGIVGTPVRLKLQRGDASVTVDVIRDDVTVSG